MKTYEIFACLKPGYKAVNIRNEDVIVYINSGGTKFTEMIDGKEVQFDPTRHRNAQWEIRIDDTLL